MALLNKALRHAEVFDLEQKKLLFSYAGDCQALPSGQLYGRQYQAGGAGGSSSSTRAGGGHDKNAWGGSDSGHRGQQVRGGNQGSKKGSAVHIAPRPGHQQQHPHSYQHHQHHQHHQHPKPLQRTGGAMPANRSIQPLMGTFVSGKPKPFNPDTERARTLVASAILFLFIFADLLFLHVFRLIRVL